MSVNILNHLEQLAKEKRSFQGAVFLTYTLNLQFFEQMVQPRLDALGCTHVLILTDPFGYQEALAQHLPQLRGVGRQYVCAPILPNGRGVQHGKLLLLLSETGGQLFIGSGNLTYYGYGQNLELFDLFHYEDGETTDRDSALQGTAPFQAVWELLTHFKPQLPEAAQDHLTYLNRLARWLRAAPVTESDGLQVWSSVAKPLADRLQTLAPVDELQVLAPFIDVVTIKWLLTHFRPQRLRMGVGSTRVRFEGAAIKQLCAAQGCSLRVEEIQAVRGQRPLHAKALVGIHARGSWCVAGSANLTRPALLDSWQGQGNVELMVYRSAPQADAFAGMWADGLIQTRPLSVAEMEAVNAEPEEAAVERPQAIQVRLVALRMVGTVLEGEVMLARPLHVAEGYLKLLQTHEEFPFTLDHRQRFTVQLERPLSGSEAGQIRLLLTEGMELESAPLFIDYPNDLQRFAARAYHRSIRSRMDLVGDATDMFKELMEFLFQRVSREQQEAERQQRITQSRQKEDGQTAAGGGPVLALEAFVTTEELVYNIGRRVDDLEPYEQNHYSLRDLLALTLLRITTETTPSGVVGGSADDEEIEERIAEETAEEEERRHKALKRLGDYLGKYCRRYNKRLQDADFVNELGVRLLLQNHHTVARTLLEVYVRGEQTFKPADMREMVRQIWLPLFEQVRTLNLAHQDEFWQRWAQEELSNLFICMMTAGWSDPFPTLKDYDLVKPVQRFLYGRYLIEQAQDLLGDRFWEAGLEWSPTLQWLGRSAAHQGDVSGILKKFTALAQYKTPTEEKFKFHKFWMDLKRKSLADTENAILALSIIEKQSPSEAKQLQRSSRLEAIVGDRDFCPVTYIEIPREDLKRLRDGELISSPHDRSVLLFWRPELDLQIEL